MILVALAVSALSSDYGFIPVVAAPQAEVDEVELAILNKNYLQDQVNIQLEDLAEKLLLDRFKDVEVCSTSSSKTYMSHTLISRNSIQGRYIDAHMVVRDGFLYDSAGFMGVALGSSFGDIGDRFIFTLSTGVELRLVKIERKSDDHTFNGCEQRWDNSVIEFVIDPATTEIAKASNGYFAQGNFNNLEEFRGDIVRVQKEQR
jgi:hypothetical protein